MEPRRLPLKEEEEDLSRTATSSQEKEEAEGHQNKESRDDEDLEDEVFEDPQGETELEDDVFEAEEKKEDRNMSDEEVQERQPGILLDSLRLYDEVNETDHSSPEEFTEKKKVQEPRPSTSTYGEPHFKTLKKKLSLPLMYTTRDPFHAEMAEFDAAPPVPPAAPRALSAPPPASQCTLL